MTPCPIPPRPAQPIRRSILGRLALATAAGLLLAGPGVAATSEAPVEEPAGRGEPMEQRFLSATDSGAVSVVTTPRGPSCVASARIDIAASGYWDEAGAALPFERIRRSPATSIQAIAGPDGATAFRIQLKFSPRSGAPLTLTSGGSDIDLRPFLEADTDSVLIQGEAAQALEAAFRAGEPASIEAHSRDTGHLVRDALPSPELDGLAACATDLDPAARPGPLAGLVSVRFEASPDPATLATPERLRACGMAPSDRPLHLGRLTATSGVFAQVSTVFVAFDEAGRVERAYVPGILDADLADPAAGALQVSQAADANVPDAANAVTGCIGAHAVEACVRSDGPGAFVVGACGAFAGGPDSGLVSEGPSTASPGAGPLQVASLVGDRSRGAPGFPGSPSGVGGGSSGGGSGDGGSSPGDTDPGRPFEPQPPRPPVPGDGGPNEGDPDDGGPTPPGVEPPPVSPVPLPASALLLLTGLGGLLGAGLVRRRA